MTSEQWKRIETLFEQTLEAPEAERPQFLQAIGDTEVRGEVESLLRAHWEAGAFLDQPDRFFSNESFEVDTLSPGQVIDRYRIIREIGHGGMGAVFLAERADDEYRKQVALKLIKRGTDTDSVLRHFRNERQILAGFDHANIARLFDGGTTESGLPYFVMEYVEGLPIDDYCNAHALSVVERLHLFREVCAAVSYAHRRLVIHRDIKRSNILITAEGVPKLLDFGIAKLLQDGDEALATVTGMRLMTPESASPEQILGQPVTTASDVYSLGVVLYELLCGCSPYRFASQAPHEMARVITEIEPKKPSTTVVRESDGSSKSQIPNPKILRGDLDNILLMALRKEPERRYQSVEQFSEDIRRHLEERPVMARKDTIDYRAAKFAQRNKAGLAAAALVLLMLVGGIVATSRQARIAMKEKARAERRFNEVRTLANSVLFDYHDAIKALPGATKVRERLVKDALTYLDSLAAEAHDDPGLQRELAAAYERVGDVRGGDSSWNLGDVAGAMGSYIKSLKLRDALVGMNPRDVQARRDLADIHEKIGYRLLTTGEATDGLEHFQKALALYLNLTHEQPADDDLQLDLSTTHNRLGRAMSQRGDAAGALEQYRAGLAICEKLAASHQQDPRYRRALWKIYASIANLLWERGDLTGAADANSKALTLAEGLVAEQPLNTDFRRELAVNYADGGDYRSQTDTHSAMEYFRKAVLLDEGLLAADSANAVTRQDVAYAHKRLAELLRTLEDASSSLLHFSKAADIYEKLAADAPADLIVRFRGITCRAGAAAVQARLGEIDSALRQCDKAIALLPEVTEDPTSVRLRLNRAQAYESIGNAYVALAASKASTTETRERMSSARDMFRQTLNVLEGLRSRGILVPADDEWAKEIAGEIAKCDAALGK